MGHLREQGLRRTMPDLELVGDCLDFANLQGAPKGLNRLGRANLYLSLPRNQMQITAKCQAIPSERNSHGAQGQTLLMATEGSGGREETLHPTPHAHFHKRQQRWQGAISLKSP